METKVSSMLSVFVSSLLLLPFLSQATSPDLSPFGFFKDLQGSKKGDKVEGIHKVRKYLQRFGYMSSTHSKTETQVDRDDHFDDALESAIKAFQTYYHLKPTGILDAPTATLMSSPRCGVPDNPSVTNNINSHGHSHLNIGTHYIFFPGKPRWPAGQTHLLYSLDSGSHPEAADAVAKAFGTWAAVSHFTFERISDPTVANIKISFQIRDHGDGMPFDGPGGTLAHAAPPTEGIFHFDGDETWAIGAVANSIDLQTVATHEIGHLLGLGHSSVEAAIMYPSISRGATKGLNQDDIDGIRALYTG
ncbi:hypothetical protein PVL29_019192 [Vitis rotundifolia]|uniref:Peptidase metallopeptidase domain-containing protein n=1 Tax=Vitis rotundifolia TaxID=103349 RepID=A0AA38Z6W0_VITRO|nr:hypothetical protein PVL29_019192 [Vitis rotundifolia]